MKKRYKALIVGMVTCLFALALNLGIGEKLFPVLTDMVSITAHAATYDAEYNINENDVTISVDNKTYRIYGNGTATTHTITVAAGVNATITLDNVNIDVSATDNACAFKIADDSTGNVTINLKDGTTNSLKSGANCAGLQKNGNSSTGTLTINGTGTLTVKGGDGGACIGGGNDQPGSNITINGGYIDGFSNSGGACIGGGKYKPGSNITINGGYIDVFCNYNAAAIGGGGGDDYGTDASNITITGGYVKACSYSYGAGIGGGYSCSGDNIRISGGLVYAYSLCCNAIGNGKGDYSSSTIIITGGSVIAASGTSSVPTLADGITEVYPLTVDNPNNESIRIDGTYYPSMHNENTYICVYLTARDFNQPHEVRVGSETTHFYYDTTTSKWIIKLEKPDSDSTTFTYDGNEKTYAIPDSYYYTVTGNEQTNAGTYTVTVSLNDTTTSLWADGTTADKTYSFAIGKAAAPTLTDVSDSYSRSVQGENTTAMPTLPTDMGTIGTITAMVEADADDIIGDSVSCSNGVVTYSLNANTVEKVGKTATIKVTIPSQNYMDMVFRLTITITGNTVSVPSSDSTVYTYNGSAQSYKIAENEDYTISGNKQTNAGTYTVTVALRNKSTDKWSDGTTTDKTYSFAIGKAAAPTLSNVSERYSWTVSGKKTSSIPALPTDMGTIGTITVAVEADADDIIGDSVSYNNGVVSYTLNENSKSKIGKTATIKVTIPSQNYADVVINVTITVKDEVTDDLAASFVDRLYENILGRDAEDSGLSYWVDLLVEKEIDGAGIARGFILSDEFTSKNLSNEEFVKVLYTTFLGREADDDGLAFWVDRLNNNAPRTEVLAGFVNSTEFSNVCDDAGIIRGTMEADGSSIYNEGVHSFVNRMYLKCLCRQGECEGVEYWSHLINKELQSPEEVAKNFYLSEEYINKNVSDADFVESLYETFMDRSSDEDGKSYWLAKLRLGTTREEVLEGFARSDEFSDIMKEFGL